jgi:ferritin-like metal-binding protein YciE
LPLLVAEYRPPGGALSKSKPHAAEHYEMTRHGMSIAWAREFGREDSTSLLQQDLKEEEASGKKLAASAEHATRILRFF